MKLLSTSNRFRIAVVALAMMGLSNAQKSSAQIDGINKKNLSFLATFDSGLKADFGKGETKSRFAEDVSRKGFLKQDKLEGVSIDAKGKFGSAIHFDRKTKSILCYSADKNVPYSEKGFDATISFWMNCDLEKLPKGYIDPLQITDKKWNDASIFVDFNDKRPADFRLGVFSDFKHWNPENRKFDLLKPAERPMVDAGRVAFAKDKWTHIGLVFKDINTSGETSHCKLYVDGKLIGDLDRKQKFTWDTKKTFIMLGIYYVGKIDDFAIFDIAMTDKQIGTVFQSKHSIATLLNK